MGRGNKQAVKAANKTRALEDAVVNQLRVKEVIEKSGVDFDRIADQLRELTGTEVPKELLKHSWDLTRVLLAEAVELRDRAAIHFIINEVIKRKEPKEQTIKTDIKVDQKVLVLVQDVESKTIEDLIARRTAITVGDGESKPVRAVPNRRSSRKKKS